MITHDERKYWKDENNLDTKVKQEAVIVKYSIAQPPDMPVSVLPK